LIEFGRAICGDLADAERREWIVTNGLGGFASGTIAGTLTRRYHGLLFAAMHGPVDRRLLVTKLDEVVHYRKAVYELATNRWDRGYLSPHGFTLIERFTLDGTTPVWHYACADALLEKRIWMEPNANVTYVRYRLLRASESVDLSLKALVNDRDFNGNTHAGDWQMNVRAVGPAALEIDAIPGQPAISVAADRGSVSIENVWYRNFVLSQETARGLDDRDDNLSAGNFSVTLAPGEFVTITASVGGLFDGAGRERSRTALGDTEPWARRVVYETGIVDAFRKTSFGKGAPAWMDRCVLAADQFIVARATANDPDGRSIIAGYHWFGDWGRDTMISLPGLTLTTGRPEIAKRILTATSSFIDGGMVPNVFPSAGETPQYNTVDAALWYIEAAARYVEATSDDATLRALWPSLSSVIANYRTGTRYDIHMDTDGLIAAGTAGVQLTWMDAKIGDWVVTPRVGKPVEIGALWYNALVRMHDLAVRLGEPAAEYASLAQRTKTGFERFWNAQTGFCYDVIDGPAGDDATLRPNQIFAVALPHSPLPAEQQRGVVDACAAQLVTSNGLRTLAPSDPRFVAQYSGAQPARDAAYHQGTVWPWLLGGFAIAHARVYGDAAVARSFLEPLVDQFFDGGLGTVSEIADGTAPFTPRGAIAQAWSVAELLRAWSELH
jgi:predicted glycogen debranching enzyme